VTLLSVGYVTMFKCLRHWWHYCLLAMLFRPLVFLLPFIINHIMKRNQIRRKYLTFVSFLMKHPSSFIDVDSVMFYYFIYVKCCVIVVIYLDFVLYLDYSCLLVLILCGIWIDHICFGVVWYPDYLLVFMLFSINVRNYRRGNQKCTIQRNWKHRAHNMWRTPNKYKQRK